MIASTTIGGIEVELILIEPDWTTPPVLELGIAVDTDEGETGKETRLPESLHPRFKMTFTPDWEASDSEDIMTLKATIGKKRVAIPLFPDQQGDITDTFLFEGAHYVSYNGSGSYAVNANTYDKIAPLVFGYLESNTFQAANEVTGKTHLNFIEDCPFSHRVKIKHVTTTSNFTLKPDWSQVRETLKTPIEHQKIGLGRERQVENEENVFRYEVDANFTLINQDELAYLLSFWYQKKGRLHPFTVPAWFQPASNTPETPDVFRVRFKGERLRLSFQTPSVATVKLGFIQLPWELNDSGIEHVTDKQFEDSSQWVGLSDGNISVVDNIVGFPPGCVRIAPSSSSDKSFRTANISGAEGDEVLVSALASVTAGTSNDLQLGVEAYDSSDSLIGSSYPSLDESETPTSFEAIYTLPANTAYFRALWIMPTDGTTGGYAYFGDCSVIQWKSGAEVLSEQPIQPPRCYAFDYSFEVPGKSNLRYIDWERSITISGNAYSPYKMTVQSLSLGTRLFKEECKVGYSHQDDNPFMEFVLGGMERLVTLTLLEGNPQRPDSFRTLFIGKLKSLRGKGRSLTAVFTAFGGVFEKKLPGFLIQSKCNYTLGDANCRVDLPSLKAEGSADSGDLTENGTKITLSSMTGTLTTVNDPNNDPGDRFAGGYLEVGTGNNYQIRFIRKTTIGTGTERTFTLNRPLSASKLDDSDGNVDVYPGCGGSKWECIGFFNNYVNFGGHPFVPDQLETVQGAIPSTGK